MATIAAGPTVTPLHSVFAAEVSGVDLSRPLDDATFERIAVAFDDHSVLVFRGQALTDEQQMAFSERWGPLEATVRTLGGETGLASMRVAYEHLPEDLRRDLDGRIVVHSFGFSRSIIDPGIGTEIGRDYPPVHD